MAAEHGVDGLRLVGVAQRRRGGVGVHIADLPEPDAGIGHGAPQRARRSVHVGHGDMVTVRREAVSGDLGKDCRPAAPGRFVAFDDERRRAAAGDEPVARPVERARGLRRLVFAGGECGQRVEIGHRVIVDLLAAAADHTLLHSVADQQRGQPDGVRTARAGPRDGEVHPFQVEDHREVHRDRRVHRLEDVARADHGGVLRLADLVDSLHHGRGAAVVAVEDADFVPGEVFGRDSGLPERFERGDVGVLSLFGQADSLPAVEFSLQVGMRQQSGECRPVPEFMPAGDDADTRAAFVERFRDSLFSDSDAGVDAHARDYDASFHQ